MLNSKGLFSLKIFGEEDFFGYRNYDQQRSIAGGNIVFSRISDGQG
jgi:hypothetical protein